MDTQETRECTLPQLKDAIETARDLAQLFETGVRIADDPIEKRFWLAISAGLRGLEAHYSNCYARRIADGKP